MDITLLEIEAKSIMAPNVLFKDIKEICVFFSNGTKPQIEAAIEQCNLCEWFEASLALKEILKNKNSI